MYVHVRIVYIWLIHILSVLGTFALNFDTPWIGATKDAAPALCFSMK